MENIPNEFVLPEPFKINEDDAPFVRDDLMRDVCELGMKTFNRKHLGHVYVLGSSTGYFKIGQTTDLVKRLKKFEVALPFKVWLELAIPFWDCIWAEKYFHAYFCPKRVNGEWFKLNYQDLIYIQNQGDTNSDTKLKILLEWASFCSWTQDFIENGLGKYNPLPNERMDILTEFSMNTSECLKEQTNFRTTFYDREYEPF